MLASHLGTTSAAAAAGAPNAGRVFVSFMTDEDVGVAPHQWVANAAVKVMAGTLGTLAPIVNLQRVLAGWLAGWLAWLAHMMQVPALCLLRAPWPVLAAPRFRNTPRTAAQQAKHPAAQLTKASGRRGEGRGELGRRLTVDRRSRAVAVGRALLLAEPELRALWPPGRVTLHGAAGVA
eukprot:COSAG01_NODE_10_length_42970_cov_93.010007_12_plen_178_part_00